ncbi:ABC transporter substrate-binding protein [Aestuariivirga sp.]|uniref:ABC transporter substrate-binding protein n=1 Tax=Aestuariivirga sp. TaxID=2650926 RepID=UPI0039E4B473
MSETMNKLNDAAKLAGKGKMSRRDFTQLALASGLTLAAADTMFSRAARAEPKKGGTLRLGLSQGATTDSLDPGLYYDQYTGTCMWGTLSNSLTEVDAKGNAVGDLAESFESSDGAKKWVFKLPKGAVFHNGKDVTAEDVVASYKHHSIAGTKSAAKSLLAPMESIKADGKHTVVITLSGGNADFSYICSDYHLPIMPANKDGTADWSSGVRTGPYSLVKFDPGVKTELTRNPHYFKTGKAWFDDVVGLSIKDTTARTNALNAGEIDYMQSCDLKTLDLLKANPNLVIFEKTGYAHNIYVMDCTSKPLDNPDVRNAIKYSIDRQSVLEKIFLNHGTVGNDNSISPAVKFAVDPMPKHVYDPAMAKSLLKKAGLDSLKIDVSVAETAFTGATDTALIWQESAKACGIEVNVIREPEDSYWDNVWMKKPICATYWSGRPNCDWMFTTAYAKDAAWNDTKWYNTRFNELLVAARVETDEKKRAAMYAEMQQLLHDDGGLINVVFNSFVDAHANTLAHGDTAANWPMDGMKIAERWWFA